MDHEDQKADGTPPEQNIIIGEEPTKPERNEMLVVGIGASAGGIKALKEFFSHTRSDSGIAYVVVLHMSPEYESKLAEILQLDCELPVAQVTEKIKIEPNHVYVVPPNQSLSMHDDHLVLSEITKVEERRAPVDVFFRTLAESRGRYAMSVTLSGTGANGSMGLKRVKELGGCCIAQDPNEAEYSDMPRNSIATGLVDFVLPVVEMPARIAAYKENLRRMFIPIERRSPADADEQALISIFTQLRTRTGHDFSNYKRATMLRRIERRIVVNEARDLTTYAQLLREKPDEIFALLKDLLISVTNFFRDPESFDALSKQILPRLFDGKKPGDQIRVWVAGCATGEEAYSLAMLLTEHADTLAIAPSIQIFATDIDEHAIAFAREGYYTLNDAADVSPERLRQFFIKEKDGYRVRKDLREKILFAHHDVIKDPPFSHLDLVTCRNLLIYLNSVAQERLLGIFHFALLPGGYLFLGGSESINTSSNYYVAIGKDSHIFQSRPFSVRTPLPIPQLPAKLELRGNDQYQEKSRLERLSYADLHQRLLEQYGPPSVVVNEEYDIVHLSEQAGRYLAVSGGEPTYNLLKIIRPELRLELRTALYQAVQRRTNVEARGLQVEINSDTETINLIVRPVLRDDDSTRGFILVIFEKAADTVGQASPAEKVVSAEPVARQLEEELVRAKSQLRATVEQYEVQHEELKASNEELQAINEELRSTAEELETSREELQSVNEELTTVNQELKIKIEELSQANNDFQNLMNSTQIGTIFLDRSLRIKLFTPRSRAIFNLLPTDVGRPLSDITSRFSYRGLISDAERVLDRLQTTEREIQTHDGNWYLMNLLPYRTAEDRIDGVVITFTDITSRVRAQQRAESGEVRQRLMVESVKEYAIFTVTPSNIIDSWNLGAERLFGYTEAEVIGKAGSILFTPEDREAGIPEAEIKQAATEGKAEDERWHIRKDGSRFFASGVMTPLGEGDRIYGYAKIARDLTAAKKAEEKLQSAKDELERRVLERTRELKDANQRLEAEIVARTLSQERSIDLLERIVSAQEDERRRVARDLHDQLGQQLTALKLKLESVKQKWGKDDSLREQLEQTQSIAQQLDADVDFLAWELRPAALREQGLVVALDNYVQEWSKHFHITCDYHTARMADVTPGLEIETNLYRIAQEALNNIAKHAKATRVAIVLESRGDNLILVIEDNGVGFEPTEESTYGQNDKGLGLTGMMERAALISGTFEVESEPEKGTTIFVSVPVAKRGTKEAEA